MGGQVSFGDIALEERLDRICEGLRLGQTWQRVEALRYWGRCADWPVAFEIVHLVDWVEWRDSWKCVPVFLTSEPSWPQFVYVHEELLLERYRRVA